MHSLVPVGASTHATLLPCTRIPLFMRPPSALTASRFSAARCLVRGRFSAPASAPPSTIEHRSWTSRLPPTRVHDAVLASSVLPRSTHQHLPDCRLWQSRRRQGAHSMLPTPFPYSSYSCEIGAVVLHRDLLIGFIGVGMTECGVEAIDASRKEEGIWQCLAAGMHCRHLADEHSGPCISLITYAHPNMCELLRCLCVSYFLPF